MTTRPTRLSKHRVGWTGGFDSTFHVLDLLDRGERVEAHYLGMDPEWSKQQHEREARDRIAAALPAEMRNRLDIVEPLDSWDPAARDLFFRLHDEHSTEREAAFWKGSENHVSGISAQIPALAAWLQTIDRGIELCYVADDIDDYKVFALRWLSHQADIELPLANRSKASFLDGRFDDLLLWTWSCEESTEPGEPCGRCQPCQRRIVP